MCLLSVCPSLYVHSLRKMAVMTIMDGSVFSLQRYRTVIVLLLLEYDVGITLRMEYNHAIDLIIWTQPNPIWVLMLKRPEAVIDVAIYQSSSWASLWYSVFATGKSCSLPSLHTRQMKSAHISLRILPWIVTLSVCPSSVQMAACCMGILRIPTRASKIAGEFNARAHL